MNPIDRRAVLRRLYHHRRNRPRRPRRNSSLRQARRSHTWCCRDDLGKVMNRDLKHRQREKLYEWQGQPKTENTAPEDQPPPGIPGAKQPMSRPSKHEQDGPLPEDHKNRRLREIEQCFHSYFLFVFREMVSAVVRRISSKSSGLMSPVSTNWATSSRLEPPAKTRAIVWSMFWSRVVFLAHAP